MTTPRDPTYYDATSNTLQTMVAGADVLDPAIIPGVVFNPSTAFISTGENTTSTTYTDLATPGPSVTVTVGSSGNLLLFFGAAIANVGAGSSLGVISFVLSGANILAPSDSRASAAGPPAGSSSGAFTSLQLTGLLPGPTTIKLQYRVTAGTTNFSGRNLTVFPL